MYPKWPKFFDKNRLLPFFLPFFLLRFFLDYRNQISALAEKRRKIFFRCKFQNIFSGFERILDEWDCEQREPNVDDLHQICLDFDLKQFGSGFLSDSRDGIVQVQKVKNVAAPSISQGQYPRMILGFGVI